MGKGAPSGSQGEEWKSGEGCRHAEIRGIIIVRGEPWWRREVVNEPLRQRIDQTRQ